MRNQIAGILILFCISACNTTQHTSGMEGQPVDQNTAQAEAPAIVYKTVKDYRNNVPVLLSADKSKIVSYPSPRDIAKVQGYPLPTQLADGYLLDNRGISKNVAFLKVTYQEYARLAKAPSLSELEAMIIDRDPLVMLCHCGRRSDYSDLVTELNALITSGKLNDKCKQIK